MVQNFNTDDEYYLAIKRFWQRYGTYFSTSLIVFLLAFYGYKFWNYRIKVQEQNASAQYIKYNQAYLQWQRSDNKNADEEEFLKKEADNIAKENPRSIYATFAQLIAAKLYVDDNELPQAEVALTRALSSSQDKAISTIVRLRLIRVYLAQHNVEKAQLMLSKLSPDSLKQPMVLEVKGDVLAQAKQVQAAKKAYTNALAVSESDEQKNMIRMKLNNLL